jgi:hypothetical protein
MRIFWEARGPARVGFSGEYTRAANELKVRACTSSVSVETPFAHVAIHASKAVNYSAQYAVKEFLGKRVLSGCALIFVIWRERRRRP